MMFYNGALDPFDKLWQTAKEVQELEAELEADPGIRAALDEMRKEV